MAYDVGTSKVIRHITYAPGDVKDSGDLEGATKTITATAEAAGVGNADYSYNFTLAKPTALELEILRVATQLLNTIDDMGGGAAVYYRVYVDVQDAAHRILDVNHGSTGIKKDSADVTVAIPTAFALLTDGAAHTLYVFMWKDATGTGVVISKAELLVGVGTSNPVNASLPFLKLTYNGPVFVSGYTQRWFAGTDFQAYAYDVADPTGIGDEHVLMSGDGAGGGRLWDKDTHQNGFAYSPGAMYFNACYGAVDELCCCKNIGIVLA